MAGMATDWTTVLVRLTPEETAIVDRLAAQRSMTRAALVKRCVTRVLAAEGGTDGR